VSLAWRRWRLSSGKPHARKTKYPDTPPWFTIRGTNAHLHFVGAFRSISFPRFPLLIVDPPNIARIAQVLAEAAR
jgi:hypothetical protein